MLAAAPALHVALGSESVTVTTGAVATKGNQMLPPIPLPALLAAVLGLILAAYFLGFFSRLRGGASSGGGAPLGGGGPSQTRAAAARAAKGAVLLCGPTGGGKTALFHRLAFGKCVDTVPSMEFSAVAAPLAGSAAGAPAVKLMDYPGAPQLRASLLRSARQCSGIVVLVDAACGGAALQGGGDVLFDLLTDPAVARGAPRLMVVASRADAPGARAPAQLRERLEAEMDRLRASRGALMQAGGEGAAGGGGAGEDAPLLLGRAGERFSLDDAPLRVEWGAVGGLAPGGSVSVEEVRAFVAEAAAS